MQTADIVVGSASGPPGSIIQVPIIIDTQGQLIRAFNIHLAYDGVALPIATGMSGAAPLPVGWTLETNSPTPGDMRFLTIDLSATPAVLTGNIITVQFEITPVMPSGTNVPLAVPVANLLDVNNVNLPVNTTPGAVTITQSPNAVIILGLPNNVVMVDVLPRSFRGTVDAEIQLSAIATFIDGTQADVTGDLLWSSGDPSVAVVSTSGLVTITGVGDTRITGVFP